MNRLNNPSVGKLYITIPNTPGSFKNVNSLSWVFLSDTYLLPRTDEFLVEKLNL